MKPPEKKWPHANAAGQKPARPTTHASNFKPPVAHAKNAAGAPNAGRPGLPPAHKPQPRPPVAQTKTALPPRPVVAPRPAPPVFPPRHAPHVMQTKSAAANRPGNTKGLAANARPAAQAAARPQVAQRKTAREATPRTDPFGRGAAPPPSRPAPRVPVAQGRAGVVQRMLAVVGAVDVGGVADMFERADQEAAAVDAARAKAAQDRISGLAKMKTLEAAKTWNAKRRAKIKAMIHTMVPEDYKKEGASLLTTDSWYPGSKYKYVYGNYQDCLPNGATYYEYGPSSGKPKEVRAFTSGAARRSPSAGIQFWVTNGGTHAYDNAAAAAVPWRKWDGKRWWKWDARSGHHGTQEFTELVMEAEVKLNQAEAKAVRDSGTHVPGNYVA